MLYRAEKIVGKQAELDLTNEKLAEAADVGVGTVSAARQGRSVHTENLIKILNVLGLTLSDIDAAKNSELEPATR